MKCPNDNLLMKPIASRVTPDEKLLITNYCCMTCLKRVVLPTPNPRYVPSAKHEQPPPNPQRRRPREKVTPAYFCEGCKSPMREASEDGLCHVCAQAA